MNQKRYFISKKVLAVALVMAVVPLFTAIFFTFLSVGSRKMLNLNAEVNATMLNGILTGTAVLFAFVTFEIRTIWHSASRLTLVLLSLPLVAFLTWTVDYYFIDAVTLGYSTVNTMITATSNFFFNIFYFVTLLFMGKYFGIESEES